MNKNVSQKIITFTNENKVENTTKQHFYISGYIKITLRENKSIQKLHKYNYINGRNNILKLYLKKVTTHSSFI